MNQITIYELLPHLKKGWVAMDKDGQWVWYKIKPHPNKDLGIWTHNRLLLYDKFFILGAFKIDCFDGDWKDSLMECGKGLRATCHNYQRAKKALEGK